MQFKVTIESPIKLEQLASMLEAYANDQWIGVHYTPQQACELLLDRFKRQLKADLKRLALNYREKKMPANNE